VNGVVVFGRQPLPGNVKTRLAQAIGADAAARVYAVLLEHALRCASQASANVVLSLASPPSPDWNPPVPVTVEVQSDGDLGSRMASAFQLRFEQGWRRVVLVGSDCAQLSPRHLLRALEGLERSELVLGPASDGGYWLVGQRPPGVDVFSGVPWSTPETLTRTRARIAELAVACSELETLDDVDTVEDLERLGIDGTVGTVLLRRLVSARGTPPTKS
jgi:uncharacterized protein